MSSDRAPVASPRPEELHLIDFSYSLDSLHLLTDAQLLCVGVPPLATDQDRARAVQELLARRERVRLSSGEGDDSRPMKRARMASKVTADDWKLLGGIRLGLDPSRTVDSYFVEAPATERTSRSILSLSWDVRTVGRSSSNAVPPSAEQEPLVPRSAVGDQPSAPNVGASRANAMNSGPNVVSQSRATIPDVSSTLSAAVTPLALPSTMTATALVPQLPPRPATRLPAAIWPQRKSALSQQSHSLPFDAHATAPGRILRRDRIRDVPYSDYERYLLPDTPIAPLWSSKYLASVASFLAACAPPESWSNAPHPGMFKGTFTDPILARLLELQPNVPLLVERGLGAVPTAEPRGPNMKIWASVRDAMIWIWGREAVSWRQVRWLLEEAPMGLFGYLMQLGNTHRFRRGVLMAWEELFYHLRSLSSVDRTPHLERAWTLFSFLAGSEERRVRFFTYSNGRIKTEPWREWFEEGADSERTLADLEEIDRTEQMKSEGGKGQKWADGNC